METISTDSPAIATSVASREIQGASEISSYRPIGVTGRLALEGVGFTTEFVDKASESQALKIDDQANSLSRLLEASRPTTYETLDQEIARQNSTKTAEKIAANPVLKLDKDTNAVKEFLQLLGPTNQLRTEEGFDAAFELARLQHMLRTDWENVPSEEKDVRMREVEAQVVQELALLWRPEALEQMGANPQYPEVIANVNDPNVFTEEQLQSFTKEERWVMIGSQLAKESAELFSSVYTTMSKELNKFPEFVTFEDKKLMTEMFVRSVDMHCRSLQIQMLAARTPEEVQHLKQEVYVLHAMYAKRISQFYNDLLPAEDAWTPEQSKRLGHVYEYVVVGIERAKWLQEGDMTKMVRLATLREDVTHPTLQRIVATDGSGTVYKLSHDVVTESYEPEAPSKVLQVKHKGRAAYNRNNTRLVNGAPRQVVDYPLGGMAHKGEYGTQVPIVRMER